MKTIFTISFVFVLAFVNAQTTINKWVPGMSVKYYHGGGMHYSSLNYTIYTDSVVYVRMEQGVDHKIKFKFSQEELDKIASLFETNDFKKLNAKTRELIHDKATTEISWCMDTNCIEKSEGATSQFNDAYRAKFNTIESTLTEMINSKLTSTTVKKEKKKKSRKK